jgi:hypothetical protein
VRVSFTDLQSNRWCDVSKIGVLLTFDETRNAAELLLQISVRLLRILEQSSHSLHQYSDSGTPASSKVWENRILQRYRLPEAVNFYILRFIAIASCLYALLDNRSDLFTPAPAGSAFVDDAALFSQLIGTPPSSGRPWLIYRWQC